MPREMNIPSISRQLSPWFVALCYLFTSPLSYAGEEIVIDNRPFSAVQTPVSVPVVGVRRLADVPLGQLQSIARTRFTRKLLFDSALQFEAVRAEIEARQLDIDVMSIADLSRVVSESGYADQHLFATTRPDSEQRTVASGFGDKNLWDATTVTNMLAANVIDVDSPEYAEIGGELIESVQIDGAYIEPINNLYFQAGMLQNKSIHESPDGWTTLTDELEQYSPLQQSLLERLGNIEFGYPVIYTQEEKGLVVPASIRNNYDVYWVDFAVTFQDVNPTALDEMAFNVQLPPGNIALELVPLRYGIRVQRDQRANSPEVEIEAGGQRIKVGEFFETVVSYNYIRPVVQAFGLRRNNFSWTLSDEAVQLGSHKFFAVLGVPKGADGVDFRMSGHFRLRKSLVGRVLGDEVLAGTDTWLLPVSF